MSEILQSRILQTRKIYKSFSGLSVVDRRLIILASIAFNNAEGIARTLDLRRSAGRAMAFAGALSAVGSFCIYASLQTLSISLVTTISFGTVFILIALSAFSQREQVVFSASSSSMIGFIGVTLIAGPSVLPIGFPLLLACLSPIFAAAHILVARRSVVSYGASSWSVALGYAVFGVLWCAIPAYLTLETLPLSILLSSVVVAGLSIAIQFSVNVAFVAGRVQKTAPLLFLRILLVVLVDFIIASNYISYNRAFGIIIVLVCVIFSFYSLLSKKDRTDSA